MSRPSNVALWTSLGLALAGTSGFLTATALGVAKASPITTTINVATGPQGPAGPAGPAGPTGPAGPAGAISCPNGYSEGKLVINHPGGQTAIWTCIQP